MMTKQQELDYLAQVTEALDDNSYLKPWLREVMAEVATDIKNDIIPSVTMAESRKRGEAEAAQIVARANEIKCEAARMLAQAREKANQIGLDARGIREKLKQQVGEIYRVL